MRKYWIIVACFFLALPAHAKKKAPAHDVHVEESKESEFKLDRGLIDTIYQNSSTEARVDASPISGAIEVSPQISFFSASKLTLSNAYFDVPYAETLGGLPMFELVLSTPLTYFGSLQVLLQGQAGYGYKEAVFSNIRSHSDANQVFSDVLKLHWIPLAASLRFDYEIPRSFVKPTLILGAGAQWLFQSGKLDGIEQGFWVPYAFVGPALTLFDQSSRRGEWFGGVTVGPTFKKSFGSSQEIAGWSLDVAAHLVL